jgi:hypothetical protein
VVNVFASEAASNLKLAPGLTVHFDAQTGGNRDLSGQGNTLTKVQGYSNNTAVTIQGYGSPVYAWTLDGSMSYFRTGPIPYSGSATNSWSMGVWCSPLSSNGNIIAMSALNPSDGWQMPPIYSESQTFNGKVWQGSAGATNQLRSSQYTIGQWYYVCLVFNYPAATQTLYVNGVAVATQTGVTSGASGTNNYIYLGKSISNAADDHGWWAGFISNFHFYGNKALSSNEVAANYKALAARYADPLGSYVTNGLGLYVDSNIAGSYLSGTTFTDLSGSGQNLTGTGNLTANLGLNSALTTASPWVTATTSLLNTDTHTISFAIKFNSTSTYPEAFSGNWEKILSFNAGGSDRTPSIWRFPSNRYLHWRYDPNNTGNNLGPADYLANTGDTTPSRDFAADSWYVVTGVKNGSTFTAYIDGVSIGGATVSATKTAGTAAIQLFEYYTAASATIDSLMIYNRALSSTEISQNYNALAKKYTQRPNTYKLILQLDAEQAFYSGSYWFDSSGAIVSGNTQPYFTIYNVGYKIKAIPNPVAGGQLRAVFDGSTSYGTYPEDTAMNSQSITVEAWIQPSFVSQNGFIFEKGNVNTQYSLFLEGANIVWRQNFGTTVGDSSTYTSLTAPSATYLDMYNWHHIVGTYSSGVRKLYVNGMLAAQDAQTGTINTNSHGASIGVYGGVDGGRGYWYNGQITELRVYNRQLSDSEVISNYKNTRKRYLQPPTTVPGAPTIGTGSATGQTTGNVPFTAPASTGGRPITQYRAVDAGGTTRGTLSQAGSGTIPVTGLSSGTSYTFYVNAYNVNGWSANSGTTSFTTTSPYSNPPTYSNPYSNPPTYSNPYSNPPTYSNPYSNPPTYSNPYSNPPASYSNPPSGGSCRPPYPYCSCYGTCRTCYVC